MAYQPEIEKLERRYADEPAKNFAQLAEAYRRVGRVDEALDILLMHLEERPNYVSALIVLGRCHIDKGSDAEAGAAFERVLAIDGENIIALKVLAEIAQRQGDARQARSWLERLLEIDPMNEEAEADLAALKAAPAAPAASAPPPLEPVMPDAEEAVATAPLPGLEPTHADVEPADPPDLVVERASAEYAQPDAEAAGDDESALGVEVSPEAELDVPAEPSPPPEEVPAAATAGPGADAPPIERAPEMAWDAVPEEAPEAELETMEVAPPATPVPEAPGLEPTEFPDPETVAEVVDAGAETLEMSDVEPFDAGLAWGTGERQSREISEDDLAAIHDADAPASPGVDAMEGLEPTDAGVAAEAETAPVEGLVPQDTALPDDTVAPARAEPAPAPTAAEPAPASDPAFIAPGPAPEPLEPAEQIPGEERGSLTGLPVILPEEGGEEEDGDPVVTETMAELYARQGHTQQAREVYEELLAKEPDNARLKARLAELQQASQPSRTESAPTDPRSRFAASRTGGVGARAFLSAVLDGRPAEALRSAPAGPARPMDEVFADEPLEPRGAPTRPASDEPTLASVFGDDAAPRPGAGTPPAASAAPGGPAGGGGGGFSFDQFFGEAPEEAPASGRRKPRLSADDIDDTDESFKAWLKGLKS